MNGLRVFCPLSILWANSQSGYTEKYINWSSCSHHPRARSYILLVRQACACAHAGVHTHTLHHSTLCCDNDLPAFHHCMTVTQTWTGMSMTLSCTQLINIWVRTSEGETIGWRPSAPMACTHKKHTYRRLNSIGEHTAHDKNYLKGEKLFWR